MESPSHIAIVTAYLYSWLKSALPIDSVSGRILHHVALFDLESSDTPLFVSHLFNFLLPFFLPSSPV
jgi:hypothetical protein